MVTVFLTLNCETVTSFFNFLAKYTNGYREMKKNEYLFSPPTSWYRLVADNGDWSQKTRRPYMYLNCCTSGKVQYLCDKALTFSCGVYSNELLNFRLRGREGSKHLYLLYLVQKKTWLQKDRMINACACMQACDYIIAWWLG